MIEKIYAEYAWEKTEALLAPKSLEGSPSTAL